MRKFPIIIYIQLYLVIIIFIFILRILKIQSLPNYKMIYLTDNDYYMITSDEIIYCDNNGNQFVKWDLEDPITTNEELEISFDVFENEQSSITLLLVKSYIYVLQYFNKICHKEIEQIRGYHSEICAFKYNGQFSYYFVGNINSNKVLQLFLVENSAYGCDIYNIVNYEINNVDSKNLNCQIMQISSDEEKLLTCFYESSNKIIASIFKTNIFVSYNEKILNFTLFLSQSKPNDGAKIIKSVLSQDKKKSFVCYTKDDNNCYCLTYDITTNKWSDYDIYLNDCLLEITSLYIEYFNNTKEYILYCFQSTTKFNLLKIDENFEIKEDEGNGIYDLSNILSNCSEYFLSNLIHNVTNITMFVRCDNSILKIKKEDAIFMKTTIKRENKTNLDQTIILTTFLETTIISTTLSESTFLTTLSETTILSESAILTTLSETTILTK